MLAKRLKGAKAKFGKEELMFLELIYNHKRLTLEQIWLLGKDFTKCTRGSINKRIYRWREDYGLIRSVELNEGGFGFKPLFSLTRKGLAKLVEADIISEQDAELYSNTMKGLTAQVEHYLSIRKIVVETTILLRNTSLDYLSEQPSPSIFQDYVSEHKQSAVPDWYFGCNDIDIYLEVDSGSENHTKIKKKVETYIEVARNNPHKHIHVVFSVFKDSQNDDPIIRTTNIKTELFSTLINLPLNLSLYSCLEKRSPIIAFNILNGTSIDSVALRSNEINSVVEWIADFSDSFSYNAEVIEPVDLYESRYPIEYRGDAAYLFKHQKNRVERLFIFSFMNEANIMDSLKLSKLSQLDKYEFLKGIYRNKELVIVGLYEESEGLENDCLPKDTAPALLGEKNMWLDRSSEMPYFYQRINSKRKELIAFDER